MKRKETQTVLVTDLTLHCMYRMFECANGQKRGQLKRSQVNSQGQVVFAQTV